MQSSIEKKETKSLKHISSAIIKALQVDDRDKDNPKFVISFDDGGRTNCMEIDPLVYKRVKSGTGTSHARLRNGLLHGGRYRFSIVVEQREEKGTKKDVVAGVHTIPDHPYIACDWSQELNRTIEPDTAVVNIHPKTGEMDIYAFPYAFAKNIDAFVKHLEGMTSIEATSEFSAGNVRYSVLDFRGNVIDFRCVREQNYNIESGISG